MNHMYKSLKYHYFLLTYFLLVEIILVKISNEGNEAINGIVSDMYGTGSQSDNERETMLMDSLQLDLFYMPKNCPEQMEQFAKHVWETGWKALPKHVLPHWLKDNDYIIKGYRPPLPSIRACFASIFRWHNETINIWTHGLGLHTLIIIISSQINFILSYSWTICYYLHF